MFTRADADGVVGRNAPGGVQVFGFIKKDKNPFLFRNISNFKALFDIFKCALTRSTAEGWRG